MFAVIVQESGDAQLMRGSGDHVATNVMPQAKHAPGIVSATWTADEAGKTLNVLVFEDELAARTASDRIRSAPRPPFMRLDSIELREVLAHF
jgi:hypothetical protein